MLLSLRHMLNGGIYDHVGGGLCRYSTDAEWLVPHFEKMLYDNAHADPPGNWAFAETGEELFRDRIETTVGWLLREMRVDGGGFAASLDADSDGEEGSYYTWDQRRDRSRPGERCACASSPPTRSQRRMAGKASRSSSANADARLDRSRHGRTRCWPDCFAAREKRVRPGRDDKVLADWNGLMIAALAEAVASLDRPDWIDAAQGRLPFRCRIKRCRRPAAALDPWRPQALSRRCRPTMPR